MPTIDYLRSDSGFSVEEKDEFMWTLVGEDDEFITETEKYSKYECKICEKYPRSQYSVVQHIQSYHHRSQAANKRRLTDDALQAVAKLEGEGFGKNFSVEGGSGDRLGFMCRVCAHAGRTLDTKQAIVGHVHSPRHQAELSTMRSMFQLKTASTLTVAEKVRAMWKLVQAFEGEYYARSHFERTGLHSFSCVMCDVSMTSPFNVAQHARGKNHQKVLENAYGQSSYYSSDGDYYDDEEYCEEEEDCFDDEGYYR